MQQKNSAGNIFADMQDTMKQMIDAAPSVNPFDLKAVLEMQRKNFQTMAEANQRVVNGWQTLAQRQTEMVSKFVQDNSGLIRETFADTTPQEKIAKQTAILKSVYETSLNNSRELGAMVTKNTQEAAEMITDRIAASLTEIKGATKAK